MAGHGRPIVVIIIITMCIKDGIPRASYDPSRGSRSGHAIVGQQSRKRSEMGREHGKGGGLWFLNPTVGIPFVCILRLGVLGQAGAGEGEGEQGEGSQPQVAHRHRVLDLKPKVIWIVAAHRLGDMPIIAIAVRTVSVIIITRIRSGASTENGRGKGRSTSTMEEGA